MKKLVVWCAALCMAAGAQAAGPRVLYLSKSSGFQHSVVAQKPGEMTHTDKHLTDVVGGLGGTITCTKDASLINADNLKNYDVVIFYTTGDLTKPGTDNQPPMGPNGQAELLSWIKGGGGFIGFHCATDTFHSTPDCGPPTPYCSMIGGEFRTHGAQFHGTLRVVSPGHALAKNITPDWNINDEWYVFCNLNSAKNMHVLALLDPGDERQKQEKYNIPSYPVIWCSAMEKGRVYYNAMGHREDVWDNAQWRKTAADAIRWSAGEGEVNAEPNYDKVVPAEK
jgi:type 1 glutamine amidotransferase